MIRCQELTKEFVLGIFKKKILAIQGLNLEVEKGEIFGFLGPNGAGKTTTLKILMGLIYPTSGKAFLLGKPIGNVQVKKEVGFLPESPYFYDYLTADEFLLFYGQLFGYRKAELVGRINQLLTLVGLTHCRKLRLRRFSKGMLQRIGIAQALINDPSLVILDEPMSGLDPVGRKEIRDLILHLREMGKTVFFSSHILSDAEMICDRVGILINGKLKDIGRVDKLVGGNRVKSVELVVEGVDQHTREKLGKLAVKEVMSGTSIMFVFKRESIVEEALAIVNNSQGKLISLIRQKESLEDLFMKEVKESSEHII